MNVNKSVEMQSQRFFIGNLPPDTSENELHKALQNYGTITNVELKKKENLVDPENVKVLAFITLNLYDGDVESCLRKINSKPINGQYVNVSVAKESFLERLKREREENASHKSGSTGYTPSASPIIQPPNKSKKFEETEENGDADICEHDDLILITKKRAANSMRNGKIVIESTNNAPVHVIGKTKDVKHLSEKSFDADKKRKESVNKKKTQYQLQKSLIQKSLSAVDTVKTKKIIFSDDNEVGQSKTSAIKSLFQDDLDQEENSFTNDFSIKSEYEGSHGAALMKLQANMNLDPRFKIDHKFIERVEDDEIVEDKNNERDWQYEILGQVVGTRVSNPSHPKGNEKKKLKMLRYDPSKENQDEFLVKRKEIQTMEVDDENALVPVEKSEVSKEVFYMVSDNLANSLKTRGDGFSLLSMFGNNDDEKEKLTNGLSKEKILISKNDKSAALNPFTYDSSESENEQEGHLQKPNKKMEVNNGQNQSSIEPKNKLFVESFFITKNDVRLKEGKTFFRCNERTEKVENYDEIKDKLKAIINTKINKSKRQLKGTIKKKSMRNR